MIMIVIIAGKYLETFDTYFQQIARTSAGECGRLERRSPFPSGLEQMHATNVTSITATSKTAISNKTA